MSTISDKSNIQALALFLIASILIFALDGIGLLRPLKFVGEFVLVRIESFVQIGAKIVTAPVEAGRYFLNGSQTVADLQARLSERIVDEVRLKELEDENERMRKLLGVDLPPNWKFLPVKVAANSTQRLIVIGNESQGVVVGATIVDENGSFVGSVLKVSEVSSEVLPVNATNSVVTARVNGESTQGVVVNGSDGLVMEKVLQEDKVEVGDIVETAGTDGLAPGVLIGRVIEVVGEGSGVYKQAKLSQLANPQSATGVFVIQGLEK